MLDKYLIKIYHISVYSEITNIFFISLDIPSTHHRVFTTRSLLSFILHKAVSSTSTISPISPIFTFFLGIITLLITEITAFIAFHSTLYLCLIRLIMVCCRHSYIIIIILKSGNFKPLKKESLLTGFLCLLHLVFQQT
ncbi:hypothetical protein CDIK_4200 [Cucumispora dikerogammari]|nr:hypothetical protein CDIK_4200 [Cucumispora dikerogammari]